MSSRGSTPRRRRRSQRPRRRQVLLAGVLCQIVHIVFVAPAPASGLEGAASSRPGETPVLGGCTVLPADNVWNARIDLLPPHPRAQAWVVGLGADVPLTAAIGTGSEESSRPKISFLEISRPTPLRDVALTFVDASDPGPYPIPDQADGADSSTADPRHLLLLDSSSCTLYELYGASANAGAWSATSAVIYDLRSNDLRILPPPAAATPGTPLLPGLLRFEEVERGEIRHALSFSASRIGPGFAWPARRAAPSNGAVAPPIGQRFRLRGDLDLSVYSERVRVVLRALQRYGMILVEEGEPWQLTAVDDPRWSEAELAELATVRGGDFVAVDSSLLQVAGDSGRVRTQLEPQPLAGSSGGPFDCVAGDQVACVEAGRFEVRVHWVDQDGTPRPAHTGATRSDDSQLFWFFEPSNWELMVKVINGCSVNGHYWVFFAGTTDRGFSLTVADSRTGHRLVYASPAGQPSAAVTDSDAFATC